MVETLTFGETIFRLERRAKSARFRALAIFALLVIVVGGAVGVIARTLLTETKKETIVIEGKVEGLSSNIISRFPETKSEIKRITEHIPSYVQIIVSAIFSFGAFALSIYLMQIAVTFIRYHTQAAEHYDAQASALRASGGDAALACSLIASFGPPPVIGKLPTAFYERAFDAIASASKSATKSSKGQAE